MTKFGLQAPSQAGRFFHYHTVSKGEVRLGIGVPGGKGKCFFNVFPKNTWYTSGCTLKQWWTEFSLKGPTFLFCSNSGFHQLEVVTERMVGHLIR